MNKRKISLLALSCILGFVSLVTAQHFWRGETMPVGKVEKKWGSKPFEAAKFKTGSEKERAEMAGSLLRQQKSFVGKDPLDIRKELGDPDGFYFTDLFPAYIIQAANTQKDEAWQIVFLLDREKKVSEIVVHKNCCE